MAADLPPLLARLHPAVVHAPIGAVLFLPLALGLALRREGWLETGRFLAILGLAGGLAALATGLYFGRELGGIHAGAWLAHPVRPEPSFPALLRTHQLLALAGFPAGAACLALLRGRRPGAVRAALAASLLWLALWGAAGHWGGRMVFKETPAEEAGP
jgi:hypothetical protein